MIKRQFLVFLVRWIASSFGMLLCISWFGTVAPTSNPSTSYSLYILAGLIFSLANSFVKPLMKTVALPLAILTMGISTAIINTLIVLLTIHLIPGVEMDILGAALSSVILSGINAIINLVITSTT